MTKTKTKNSTARKTAIAKEKTVTKTVIIKDKDR
jgi:hypothetical protein